MGSAFLRGRRSLARVTTASISIVLNGEPRDVSASGGSATVAVLISELDLGDRRVAVEVNGNVIPRTDHSAHALSTGDNVEVVTFVGGG